MAQQAKSPAEALLELAENMRPVIETAEGQRKLLEERGWSPSAAETYALELLVGMTRALFAPPKSSSNV